MLFLLISIIILIKLFFGVGYLASEAIGSRTYSNPFIHVFLGIFFVSFIAMAGSLVFPLYNIAFILTVLFSVAGLAFYTYKNKLPTYSKPFVVFYMIAIVLVSLIMGYLVYPYNTDTDFYHANAVRWLRDYGTVIGLANLNQRFGVNSSWHVLAAVLDHFTWEARTTWIMPSLAYASTFGYFLWEIFHSNKFWKKVFGLLVIGWTFINILTWGFPCLHYDFMPLVFNAILVYEALKISLEDQQVSRAHLLVLFLLATASFLIKPMGAMSIVFIFLFICHQLSLQKKFTLKNIFLASILPAIAFAVWLARNIMMSGWPFYPSPNFPLHLEWTTPFEMTHRTYVDVLYWARRPLPDYMEAGNHGFLFWFIPWVKLIFTTIRFWIVGTIPFIIGLISWGSLGKNILNKRSLFFLSWSLASLLFWFMLAPDIRFGDGFFIVFCASGLAFAIEKYSIKISEKNITQIVSLFFLVFFAAIVLVLYKGKRGPVNLLTIGKHESGPVVLTPVIENGKTVIEVWQPVKVETCLKATLPHICPSNVDLYKEFAMCSNSPLPCTGYYFDKVRFRVEGHMEKGFRISE